MDVDKRAFANIPVALSAIMPRDDIWPEVIRFARLREISDGTAAHAVREWFCRFPQSQSKSKAGGLVLPSFDLSQFGSVMVTTRTSRKPSFLAASANPQTAITLLVASIDDDWKDEAVLYDARLQLADLRGRVFARLSYAIVVVELPSLVSDR